MFFLFRFFFPMYQKQNEPADQQYEKQQQTKYTDKRLHLHSLGFAPFPVICILSPVQAMPPLNLIVTIVKEQPKRTALSLLSAFYIPKMPPPVF